MGKVGKPDIKENIKVNNRSLSIIIRIIIILVIWFTCYSLFRPDKGGPPPEKQYYTILVLGTDKMDRVNRSDTIILGFLDIKAKKASALFIPRDTRAYIPGIGMQKINAAYALGSLDKYGSNGLKKSIETIEDFLGIKIDFHAKVDLKGFVNIIDALGGITVNVSRNMNYTDRAGGLYIDIKKGLQVLNGEKAMQYVRFREKLKGDIGRITRQQKFIKAVLKKVKSPAILLKIPKIMSIIYDNLSTDMDIVTMLKLLNCYKSMPGLSAVSLNTLPGIPKYIDKKSYFVADLPKFEKLYQKFFPSFFKTPAVPDPTNSIDSGAEEPKGSKLSLTPEQGVFKELTSESDSAHGAADEAE